MSIEIDLSGRTTLVTGGGRGIGEEIATRFAQAGSDVVVVARTESEIAETAEKLESYGVTAEAIQTDLSDVEEIRTLLERTRKRIGVPDILVNNAGVNLSKPLFEQTTENLDTMYEVNLRGLLLLSRSFAEEFRDSSKAVTGKIVNISSIYGEIGIASKEGYTATKAGVNGVTQSLAADLSEYNITVNCVTPARIQTERIANVKDEENGSFDAERIPLGRLGRPSEVANACLLIASPLTDYTTGENIRVDGGIHFTSGPYRSTGRRR